MPKIIDIAGMRFGRYTVISRVMPPSGGSRWLCRCDCGTEKVVASQSLRNGAATSCGCFKRDNLRVAKTTHGDSRTKTYRSWQAMKSRCSNAGSPQYKNYGAIGVTVCKRWADYSAFLSDMGERPDGTSLDRIDPHGNYEPGNCRWASRTTQARNTRQRSAIAPGIHKTKAGTYFTSITVNGKPIYLGTFKDKDAAITQRLLAQTLLWH